MPTITCSKKILTSLAFCSLAALAACGGGGGSPEPGPGPVTPPPVQETPVLAATYTDIMEDGTLGQANWQEGSGTGAPIDGVKCLDNENYHIHSLISIYRNGTRLALPASIGLKGCAYELHTHDATGVVHVETDVKKTFTMGQFFSVWGQPLGISNVAGLTEGAHFYLIEQETVTPYTGNPADIEFTPRREIAIVVGTPPAALAKHSWPNNL